ncbi:MAG: response regulator [Caulobacterales bacterium]|nr:response regulator [Caulobacterales bacterium]
MIVDDNRANRVILKLMVEQFGFATTLAEDGIDAVAAAQDKRFDIIFMDLHMPRMDGFEATRKIRALSDDGQPPIIAVTADSSPGVEKRVSDAGMDFYILKPIQFVQLFKTVERFSPRPDAPNPAGDTQ